MVEETLSLVRQELTTETAEDFYEKGNECFSGDQEALRDQTEAVSWYLKAALLDTPMGQYFLGQCYAQALGVLVDTVEAYKWFRLAADQGHEEAQQQVKELAPILEGEGLIEAQTTGEGARDAVINQIDLDALVREGKRIYRGEGMTEGDIRAFGLFLRAAAGGHREAQYLVSRCYHWEHGVQLDEELAVDWLRRSAEAGFAEAQYWLGNAYSYGDWVLQDEAEAFKWYNKAAEQGSADAQHSLGLCYQCGNGVPKDESEAAKWYRKAAEQEHLMAQRHTWL